MRAGGVGEAFLRGAALRCGPDALALSIAQQSAALFSAICAREKCSHLLPLCRRIPDFLNGGVFPAGAVGV